MENKMKIIFADINKSFINEVDEFLQSNLLEDIENVSTFCGSFEKAINNDNEINCMVGAGNSFGSLSGGVDLAIKNHFGFQLQERLQNKIDEDFCGELNVGSSLIVETLDNKIQLLGYTPTMRVPKSIKNTDIPYMATWSMLATINKFNKSNTNKIDNVIFPGMGTGTGEVDFEIAAKQMLYAISNFNKFLKGKNKTRGLRKGYVIEDNLGILDLI